MCLTTNYTLNGARTPLADHVSVVVFTGTRKDVRFLFFLPPDKNHVFWTPNARVTIEPGTGWIKVAEKILSEVSWRDKRTVSLLAFRGGELKKTKQKKKTNILVG
jgi:hypothetical protein